MVARQEEDIRCIATGKKAIQDFLNLCSSARAAFSQGQSSFPIEEERLRPTIEECEDELLAHVTEVDRGKLWREAGSAAFAALMDSNPHLGDLKILAQAEVELKILRLLTLQSGSQVYATELRAPAWDRAIEQAKTDVEAACAAWRSCAEQHAGINSRYGREMLLGLIRETLAIVR
jgi:hypothetical protein